MPGPNFKRVARTSILEVCAHLGIDLKQRGNQWRGKCPICDHPSERAFVVTVSLNRFWCHATCKNGGDPLQLFSEVRQLYKYHAALEMEKNFNSS